MKRVWIAVAVVAVAWPLSADAQDKNWASEAFTKCSGSLAIMTCRQEDEIAAPRTLSAPAVCIALREGKFGVLLTPAFSTRTRPEMLKDFKLILPGRKPKTLGARLLGIDPESGVGFVEATDPHTWTVTKFAKAALTPGQSVVSVGLFSPSPDYHEPCIGVGHVSTTIYLPEPLVYVTGGGLTSTGSLVFTPNSGGKAVGIVLRQPYEDHQMMTNRGAQTIRIRSQQTSQFFTPTEEIAHILNPIPTPGSPRKLSWIGVLKFLAITSERAKSMKLDRPGVLVDQVIPGDIGEKAGLVNQDVVVAVNDAPLPAMPSPNMVAKDLLRQIRRMRPGAKLKLSVITAKGQPKTVNMVIGEMPLQPQNAKRYFAKTLGILVREKVPLDKYIDTSPTAGVPGLVVLTVGRDGPAALAGLKANDVVTRIGDQDITTVRAFETVLTEAATKRAEQTIILLVRRGTQNIPISIRPPKS
jgi:S1-C subfamily serine protease